MSFLKNNLSRQNLLFGLLVFLFAFTIYLPSLKIPFINDEIYFIQRNEVASPLQLYTLFEKKDYDGYYYRPLPDFISGLTTMVFGYNYKYYRLFNILLHASAALLVYLFIMSLLKIPEKKLIALFAALFFAAFPLHDYSVIWHTDLFDRIMIIVYLAGLLAFIKNNFNNSVLSLLLFFLALLSKEMAFSFPLIIALIYFFFNEEKFNFKKSILKAVPYIIIAALFILGRIWLLNNDLFTAKDAHSHAHLIDVIKNYILFSGILSFPFYLRDIQSFILTHKLLVFSAAVISFALIIYTLLKYRRKDYLIYFFVLFYILTLAPASRLFMRWYLYLPSIGFTALISYLFIKFVTKKYKLNIILPVVLLVIYSGTLLHKEFKWVEYSNESVAMLKNFIKKNKNEIVENNKAEFLTVPAKVDDIPIFQLGFDYLFNYYLNAGKKVNVDVVAKSYMKNLYEKIAVNINNGRILLTQTDDNYFILFNNEKNIKFEPKVFKNGKLKSLIINQPEEDNKILYTFSNGKFYKIKGL